MIYHTFGRNQSLGPLAKNFDVVLLYQRQLEIAQKLCPIDNDALVFPFWRLNGISIPKEAKSINAYLKHVFPFAPHATRDICVMLCVASGLSMEQTQDYLLHKKHAETMKMYYLRFLEDYQSYPSDEGRDQVFGYLTRNIKLNPITVQSISKQHETKEYQGAAMENKKFTVHPNAYSHVSIPKEYLDFASTSTETRKAVNKLALILIADQLTASVCPSNEQLSELDIFYSLQTLDKYGYLKTPLFVFLIVSVDRITTRQELNDMKTLLGAYSGMP